MTWENNRNYFPEVRHYSFYRNQSKSSMFTHLEWSNMKTDGTIRFVSFFYI